MRRQSVASAAMVATKSRSLIVENPPKVQFNPEALLRYEQMILSELNASAEPLTAQKIYEGIIQGYSLQQYKQANSDKDISDKEILQGWAKKYVADEKTYKDPRYLAFYYNKVFHTEIPTYDIVKHACEDFVLTGWIGKRQIGRRTFYFISVALRKAYERQQEKYHNAELREFEQMKQLLLPKK